MPTARRPAPTGLPEDRRTLLQIARQTHATVDRDLAALATGRAGKSAAAAKRGGAAHEAGDAWEDDLSAADAVYRDAGLGVVEQLHPEVGGPPGRMFYRQPAVVDRVGYLRARDGRPVPVAFDAKSYTGRADFALVQTVGTTVDAVKKREQERRRAERQCRFLRDFGARGDAAACFLVRCRDLGVVWCVSGPAALDALGGGGSVALRTYDRRTGVYTHHWPTLRASPAEAIRQGRPRWDYRALLAVAFPHLFPR